MEADDYGLTLGTCFVVRRLDIGRGRRAAVDFVVCFGCGGFFRVSFLFDFFSLNAHGLLKV